MPSIRSTRVVTADGVRPATVRWDQGTIVEIGTGNADHDLGGRLEKLRVEAGARMGMAESAAVPKIAFVAPAADYTALDGTRYAADFNACED